MSLKNFFLLIFILSIFSCQMFDSYDEDECTEEYKPFDCIEEKPTHGTIVLIVTINEFNQSIPIIIYNGAFENNDVILADTLYHSSKSYLLTNGNYSAKATYFAVVNSKDVSIFSVDGGKLSPDSEDYCDGTCYYEGILELDVELDESLLPSNDR